MRGEAIRRGRLGARLLCVVLSVAVSSGCRTTRPIPPGPGGYQESLRPGEQVRIVMRDGAALELTISAVTREAIAGAPRSGGPDVAVPFSRIASIERTEFSAAHTTGLVAGVGAAVVAILAVVFFVVVIGFMTSSGARPAPGQAPHGGTG